MADANYTRMPTGLQTPYDTPIMDMCADWQGRYEYLASDACAAMEQEVFDAHVSLMTDLERRIAGVPAISNEELVAKMIVASCNGEAADHINGGIAA